MVRLLVEHGDTTVRILVLYTSDELDFLQLRLNKVSELIHNSTHHRSLQQARVSVFFEEIVETVCYLWLETCDA